ncbi:MAG: glutathione S-transferase family protein [Pseudomonadota bacterium]
MSTPTMISLLPSTDADLARWMLQVWNVDYVERPHAPIFHIAALQKAGFEASDNPGTLIGNTKLAGIDALAKHFDPEPPSGTRLLPDDPSAMLEDAAYYRLKMGGGVVIWAYFHFMQEKRLVIDSFVTGVPLLECVAVRLGFPFIRKKMTEVLKLSPQRAAEGMDRVNAGFDKVEALLADGRPYLQGDTLTLLDLAFAASAAPMVLAKGYAGHLPTIDMMPPDLATTINAFRDRPGGAFIQRLYDTHRTG